MPIKQFTRAELHRELWTRPRTILAKELGISANGLTRLCDRMRIPYPPRGYWAKPLSERSEPVALPHNAGGPDDITFTPRVGTGTRRVRSRMSRADRAEHILNVAARIIYGSGLPGLSIREISREGAVSEALIYSYFGTRNDVLRSLAQRELEALSAQLSAPTITGGDTHQVRVDRLTSASLQLTAERGELLQILLADPQVRGLIRKEYQAVRGALIHRQALGAAEAFGIPIEIGLAHTHITFSVSLRVGKNLGKHAISLSEANRLCHGVQHCGASYREAAYRAMRERSMFPVDTL